MVDAELPRAHRDATPPRRGGRPRGYPDSVPAAPPRSGVRPLALVGARDEPPRLVPLLAAGDDITPERERLLTTLATAARGGDRAARDALYLALSAKIDRFVAGCRRLVADDGARRDGRPWDLEDVAQEAFPVFADLVAAWPADGPFGPYFLAAFPRRLRNACRDLRAQRRLQFPLPPASVVFLRDGTAAAEEASARLRAVAGGLPPPDGAILLGHVGDGESLCAVARRLGLPRHVVSYRWRALLSRLRDEEGADGRRPALPSRRERHDSPG